MALLETTQKGWKRPWEKKPERKKATFFRKWLLKYLARQGGFEPTTVGLEGRCSIRLSYWRAKLVYI